MSSDQPPTPLQRFGLNTAAIAERWIPDPFVFALGATYCVFVAGLAIEGHTAVEMLQFWFDGFWSLLAFGMQVVITLATGYVLAYHPRIRHVLARIAAVATNGRHLLLVTAIISMAAAWIHWGLGLIIGGVAARELGRQAHHQDIPVHYPLLCVAGYIGLGLTWHWGLSGSAPLLMNTPHNIFVGLGAVGGLIPLRATIFHPYTLTLTLISSTAVLLILTRLSPPTPDVKPITEYLPESKLAETVPESGSGHIGPDEESRALRSDGSGPVVPAERLNQNRVVGALIALGGIGMTGSVIMSRGFGALTLNVLNFAFLFVGLALFTRPVAYQSEFYDAVSSGAGIVLQYPFYAGIIGMMNYSGLTESLTTTVLSFASSSSFPVVTWLLAVLVNLFVPSGGAEWTAIGPFVLEQAQALGVPPGQAVVAFSTGDAHGNLIQPFWVIPILGITGLRAREFFGYAITLFLLLVPVLAVVLFFLPY